jgi:hypothetical protein
MDEIDRLIEDSFEDDDTPVEEPASLAAQEPVDDTAVDDAPEDDEDYRGLSTDDGLDDGDDAPGDEPDVTQQTQEPQGPSPQEYQYLQEQFNRQQYALQQLMQQQQRARAIAEMEAFEARLTEMEPDEAARARLEMVQRTYQQQINASGSAMAQMQQQLYEMQEMQARPTAVQTAIDYYKLPESDRGLLMRARDADQLDELAQGLKEKYRNQTSKARKSKAAIATNPAHRAGPGGKAVGQQLPEPTSLDELIDQMTDGLFAHSR